MPEPPMMPNTACVMPAPLRSQYAISWRSYASFKMALERGGETMPEL
jgi:hypothetical protein